ncbi:hypothetical protein GIB67_004865 [Kingdonia uniflora]|uniref:Uncharacterized protein n=1 Tax=Kingdonia uniflora TaxID=39325 RepID=A0A7J7LNR1_9MAGN|nr:hypothetical protein GIB67_004865 [Kingdonia uniflora]
MILIKIESKTSSKSNSKRAKQDLTRKIEEKDAEINKGQKKLAEAKEETGKLNVQNDALMVKSKEADMAQYRIQLLKTTEKELRRSVANLKGQMISKANEQERTQADLVGSKSKLERLKSKMVKKESDLKRAQDDLSNSEIVVEQFSAALPVKDIEFNLADLATANSRAKKAEAGERSRKNKGDVGVSIIKGDVVSLSAWIRELEGDVARTQAHVQKENEERDLEQVIRGKEQLIRNNDELLKKSPTGKSVGKDRELEELRAQVAELRMINQAESDKAVEKAKEHINFMSRVDSHMEWQEAWYKKL